MNKYKNAVIYCRVSCDEQAKGTSLDFQEASLTEYCRRNNINVLHEPFREDYSAKTFSKRPEIKKMMNFLKSHKNEVDVVLFYTWDRYSRSLEYALTNIRQLKKLNIEVNSIVNPLDNNASDFPTMLGIYIGSAESENNKISLRTKNGIHEKAEMGKCTNKAPRGYRNVQIDDHNKYVEIIEEEAIIIRQIFAEVAKGVETATYIRKQFLRKGYKIPETSFFELLRNQFYIGQIFVREFVDVANERKTIPAHYVKGLHEPILKTEKEVENFWKVQEILDGKKKKTPKLSKKVHPDAFLRKYLKCPVCGASMTGAPSKGNGGTYYYYNCSKDGKHFRCRAENAIEGFTKYISSLKPNKEVLKLYTEALNFLNKTNNEEKEIDIQKFDIEIMRIEERRSKLEDMYMDEKIKQDDYDRMKERYKKEIAVIQEKKTIEENLNRSNIEPKLKYSIDLIDRMDYYIKEGKVEVKCKLLSSMFPEKVVFDGNSYRTNSYNSVLDLIYKQTNELRGKKRKNGESFSTFSISVPRADTKPTKHHPIKRI
ncbi:hypothetical protein HMPREF9455_03601 [Dysgonomonas gadei ATCC BAA-286]|uniref:Resolvase/invertase-type recombinase catalytic domain-containing protein n=2 Tax=Dysgonomonas gadei TaxID=156974 RepID=F5J2N4_9BACT|nr:hypothetical protein HMPREF9455_03601 [Dysgonomonas gadei ATCC BAA-286]